MTIAQGENSRRRARRLAQVARRDRIGQQIENGSVIRRQRGSRCSRRTECDWGDWSSQSTSGRSGGSLRAGPGWDFNFSGACLNDDSEDPTFWDGRIGVFCDAAPLPIFEAADYTGVEIDLPGFYDEATGEPYFAVYVGESCEVSEVWLRFAERDGSRYRIELSGATSVLGHQERFDLSAWADELADHAHLE